MRDSHQAVDSGDRRHEAGCRSGEHLTHRPLLCDNARLDDDQPVGECDGIRGIVCDRDGRGRAELVAQHPPDVTGGLGVEGHERLVEQHDAGGCRERASDGDTLLFATGQLVRHPRSGAGQPDAAEPIVSTRSRGTNPDTGRSRTECDVLARREMGEQPWLLPEQHDSAAHRLGPYPRLRDPIDDTSLDRDLAPSQRLQSGEGLQQRRLARAARTHHRDRLPRLHLQRDVDREVLTRHDDVGAQALCTGHRAAPGRHPRTSSSTRIAVTSSSSARATAAPWVTPAPLKAV